MHALVFADERATTQNLNPSHIIVFQHALQTDNALGTKQESELLQLAPIKRNLRNTCSEARPPKHLRTRTHFPRNLRHGACRVDWISAPGGGADCAERKEKKKTKRHQHALCHQLRMEGPEFRHPAANCLSRTFARSTIPACIKHVISHQSYKSAFTCSFISRRGRMH